MHWSMVFWLIIGVFFAIAIGIGYAFAAKIYGYKVAIKATFQYLAILGVFLIAHYVLFLFLPSSLEDAFWIVLDSAFSVIFIIMLIAQIQGKKQVSVENVLLDLGLDNNGFWLLLGGVLLIMWSFSSVSNAVKNSQFTAREMADILFMISGSILALYKGVSKTVFTDKGVYSLFGYTKWENIRSYNWEDSKLPMLKLRVTGLWWLLNRTSINIPIAYKNAVQDLLSREFLKPESG